MSEETPRPSLRRLDLDASQHQLIAEVLSASIAVNVYRELNRAQGDSGCNIIGNCSSCSKLVAEEIQ